MIPALLAAALLHLPEAAFTKAFVGHQGALALIDCKSGEAERYNPDLCARRLPPCSTFKIWNTAIGLETGILTSAEQPFFKWDGEKRFIDDWNQDLTLRQAYTFSCVPAYQALARKIGPARMNGWIHKLGYGNEDTSSGNDVFWLPAPDRKPILISPDEQADLIRRLVNGDLPFSKNTLAILKDIMTAKTTARGTLFGKTGTGGAGKDTPAVGWFVGYVTSDKSTVAFACVLTGQDATGKNARALVEKLLL
ncbi:MAG: class D beta-lactamase [Verrucomicrobiaceae bacterium]|nr:MAG: class D beta-lactamase [Verrucomicrobiaceae bacterium]